jgi:hypothetical protein
MPTPTTRLPIVWPQRSGGPGSHGSRTYGARAARSLENGIAASITPKVRPAGRVTFRVRDAAIAQPAQSFGTRTAPELLASSGQEIRKTCATPAYLRVVIEKHRTQASRTMNAEPAQAAGDRVD